MKECLLILTLAGTVFAQEFLLPIGENVDRREMEVSIGLGNDDTGEYLSELVSYVPAMGSLEQVIEAKLASFATNPPAGTGQDTYSIQIIANPGPYAKVYFSLQRSNGRWVIPEEVLDIELEYGEVTVTLTGITKVEIEVRGEGQTERFSSDGSGVGSPCYLQAIDRDLKIGEVRLAREYVNPKYRPSWITEGEVILWEEDRKAVFNILNGYLIEASDPKPVFLASLVALPLPPRITAIKREGNITTLTVESVGSIGTTLVLWKEKMGDDWQVISYASSPLRLNASGIGTLLHETEAPTGFYRIVRSEDAQSEVVKPR
ncbi:MAG: hypothetical protein Greene041679_65 [Parcubacteria group bacterium Greene0416_79]|nr:MAG: hypothetical protein Greene041679_65 [Parcubacteria group bacterium Greene0416_79]